MLHYASAMLGLDLVEASKRMRALPGVNSTHIEHAVAEMSARYRPHRLAILGRDVRQIDFQHHSLGLPDASINLLRYGPDVMIDAGDFESFYMLELPLTGGVEIEYGPGRISSRAGTALFLSPGERVLSHWRAGTTQIMLRLDRSLVESAFARTVGAPAHAAPVFSPEFELDTAVGRRVMALFGLMISEQMESSAAGRDPLAAGPIIGAILETLILHLPYRRSERSDLRPPAACPRHIRTLRLILDDPEALTLSVSELARRIGVSERTLAKGTRRFLGVTPYEYLTRRRMGHARTLLERREFPVARVAALVGYGHPGRFAAAFRAFSGSYPSLYEPKSEHLVRFAKQSA